MSAACGLVYRDGRPDGAGPVKRMLDALDHWGADARGEWSGAGAALGHLLLGTPAETGGATMPVRDGDAGLVLTGDLRLDNREELAGQLGIPRDELRALTDGQVVLRAYRRWGEETPARLLGDFAFAVWEERGRRLFCARDAFGVKPFYYHAGAEAFAFATEIKGLLALDLVPREVDEVWIADFLCRFVLDRQRTFYAAIRRLEPAHALVVTSEGVRHRRYWMPDPSRRLPSAGDQEYLEAFGATLRRAVRRRIPPQGAVGAELSGGLDSSGICALAQGILSGEGRALHTFAQVRPVESDGGPLPPDGRDEIEALCAHADLAPPVYLTGQREGNATILEWAIRHRDQPPQLVTGLLNDGLYAAARERGVTVLLSGFGGNQGVTGEAGGVRVELLRGGRWLQLWQELTADGTPGRALKRLTMTLLHASPLGHPVHRYLERNDAFWQKLEYRPIRDDLARRLDVRGRARAFRNRTRGLGSAITVTAQRLQGADVALRLEDGHAAATARRLEYRYPLLDRELVELYLAMPPRMRRRGDLGRYLFRESLRGVLPEEVRALTRRASANPGGALRKRKSRDRLRERLRSLPEESPVFDYVDRTKALAQPTIRRSADIPWGRDTGLLHVLTLEGMLERLVVGPGG